MEHEEIWIAGDKIRGGSIGRDFEELIVFWVTAQLNRFCDIDCGRRSRVLVEELIPLFYGEVFIELLAVQHVAQFVKGSE